MTIGALFDAAAGGYDTLAAGGHFVNADQIRGETAKEETRYQEWWLLWVREAGVSEENLADALARMRADKNATLEAQMSWLAEVGFESVCCVYKDHRFAVYGGRKGRGSPDNRKDANG